MMHESDAAPQRIALIGAPIEVGTHEPGALMGPAALRTAGLVRTLRDLGHAVEDRGDIAPAGLAPGATGLPAVAAWAQALSEAVEAALDEGAVPLAAGGDHSLSLGSVDGAMRHCARTGRPLMVLWLDAHADFNTLETSPSGNVHGMPLAALCGEPGFAALFRQPAPPPLDPRRVHLFGLRSVDAGERALVRARKVGVTDMREIDEFGVVAPLRRLLERAAEAGAHLHVSFDIDFLDPSIA
ncbi:MAG: arginase, partial [Methylobacterium sp.]